MDLQYYLIRNWFNYIIDEIHHSEKVNWIKKHYNYYSFRLSFEECSFEAAQEISEKLRDTKEKAKN